jgi:alkylation response protein AidB-like acyl-CoA dehydrogenase
MGTSVPVFKYADDETKSKYLPKLTAKDDTVWQGATWMTEIKGGSDLGNNIKTTAVKDGNSWKLTGDKYFCSNAGSELAVVAARPENVEKGVKGIALFLVPRYRENGKLNYTIRRLKDKIATRSVPTGEVDLRDSDAFLLGNQELGIYVIMEVLNISRVANSVGSVALAQRAISEAFNFAKNRRAFGKPIIEHSLLNKQFEERYRQLQNTFSLAWEAVRLLDEVWNEKPPYSDRYHLFRLIAHLAKYWTAEFAVDTAKWAMEVHGGLGTLQEYPVERWLREAMILSIWEGTSHRQILDGLAVMEKKNVHRVLAESLSTYGNKTCLTEVCNSIDHILSLQKDEKEASAENVFREFAKVVSISLFEKYKN